MLRLLYQPYTLVFLVLWVVLGVLWYRRRERRWVLICLTGALGLLMAISIPIVNIAVYAWLERGYAVDFPDATGAEAIVVLGGYARPVPGYPTGVMTSETLNRCIHTSELYRRSEVRPVVVTGGDPSESGKASVSSTMADYLRHYGIPADALLVESQSRNTFENARETWKLLEPLGKQRILLVTDASHMNRSRAAFMYLGFDVIPAPCHFQSRDEIGFREFLPMPQAPHDFVKALHEVVGSAWYAIRGYRNATP